MTEADFAARLRRLLPRGWFGDPGTTPFLDGVLGGLAHLHAVGAAWVEFAAAQLRLGTAIGEFLDMLSGDFLGSRLPRRPGELDAAYRARIRREILRPRATRAALAAALTDLTGQAPVVFEPGNATDTGGWDTPAFAWDTAGAWGEPSMAYQALVTAYRPPVLGVASVAGWETGGFLAWCADEDVVSVVSDRDVRDCVLATIPAATVIWLSITNNPTGASLLDDTFILDESDLS